ncbi:hypothetical protein L596_001729 [Steinernema carpocapsae]|uniref:Uncharacterized protein n=1 Tax=Steinernema carpocapsae TaxID=34508 RepID=A0A4U8UMD4_STECR|nr:hypothetical protein L596_001729 [Steinernema carpocapsae]
MSPHVVRMYLTRYTLLLSVPILVYGFESNFTNDDKFIVSPTQVPLVRLTKDILNPDRYDTRVRPMKNHSKSLKIHISMSLYQIIEVVRFKILPFFQTFKFYLERAFTEYQDERLDDSSEHLHLRLIKLLLSEMGRRNAGLGSARLQHDQHNHSSTQRRVDSGYISLQ